MFEACMIGAGGGNRNHVQGLSEVCWKEAVEFPVLLRERTGLITNLCYVFLNRRL